MAVRSHSAHHTLPLTHRETGEAPRSVGYRNGKPGGNMVSEGNATAIHSRGPLSTSCRMKRIDSALARMSRWTTCWALLASGMPLRGAATLFRSSPGIAAVMLNIGTNMNPLMPPANDSSTVVVAFEPVVPAHLIHVKHPRLFIVPAAVGTDDGLVEMNVYGRSTTYAGSSSSLLELPESGSIGSSRTQVDLKNVRAALCGRHPFIYAYCALSPGKACPPPVDDSRSR